jgi:hypothetical protein
MKLYRFESLPLRHDLYFQYYNVHTSQLFLINSNLQGK